MSSFFGHMMGDIAQLESKAFNIVEETGMDFIKNVRNEFNINTNKNMFTHKSKSIRTISNTHRSHRRI
jgi:hypothetical protein